MKHLLRYPVAVPLLCLSFLVGCTAETSGPQTLTVMVHDSFAASEEVIQAFEEEHNARVVFLQSGDAGTALNRAILAKESPLADVFFGVDNTFLSRALDADIFVPSSSVDLSALPGEYLLDPSHRLLPVDYGDVCVNYDKSYFSVAELAVPSSLEDLAKPEYRGLLVVENPATSSTGLAFMLATRAHFADEYLDFWASLKENDVTVVDGWETAYYTNFSGSSGRGPQPLVVSYATSPAAEVIFADPPVDEAPTGSVLGPDTCFRQIEFVGVLTGARQPALAADFVAFMLDRRFQEDVPLQMFVFPVHPDAGLPGTFAEFASIPAAPATLPPEEIAANRDAWISEWTELMLG